MRAPLRSLAAVAILVAVITIACVAVLRPPERWSDQATWAAGIPREGANVTIPAGKTVLLDVSPPRLASLVIDGRLIVPDRSVRLEAGSIAIHGSLDAGSQRKRFAHHFKIILDGASVGQGAMSASGGGRIEMWGAAALPWTRLALSAQAGDRSIRLQIPPDWKRGDRIVIAPSGYDALETEQRTIASVTGTTVTLDSPLRYGHWGAISNGVDERAEVGLLSHTITIQGESTASHNGLGGQVLILAGGTLHASDVAFEGLGQRGQLGKYPVHFHLSGNAHGSFIEGSSIAHSNNRCVAIHGTQGVVARNNVAFDTIGHCYFLEDGIETGNTLEGNLGLLTRAADARSAILPSDVLPATYWITNPDNIVRNNVAAGSQGNGFWYNLSPHPTGPSATSALWPRRTPLAAFSGNVSHTNEMNGLFVDILQNPPGVTEAPNYDPPEIADFAAFTSYKNRRRGAWLRGTKLRLTNATIADNSIGVTFAGADAICKIRSLSVKPKMPPVRQSPSNHIFPFVVLNSTTGKLAWCEHTSSTFSQARCAKRAL